MEMSENRRPAVHRYDSSPPRRAFAEIHFIANGNVSCGDKRTEIIDELPDEIN